MTVKFNDGREITAIEVVLNEIFDALYNIGYYDGL